VDGRRIGVQADPVDPHHLSPKVAVRADSDGWGTYALAPIAAGETVGAFGGRCVTTAELDGLNVEQQVRSIQIDDELFLTPDIDHDARWRVPERVINHSCAPNCGLSGGVLVVAMRDVAAGETLSFDRAMCVATALHEFRCDCGAATCRLIVTAQDWMRPDLQITYRGFFSPFLARRITALVASRASRRAFSL
jgi:SET domain-containing protein